MLEKSLTINCANCFEKKCLRFSEEELATPDYLKEFPASSYDEVCLSGAIKFQKGNILIDKEKCFNCGMCSYRCPENKIKMDLVKRKIDDSSISELFRDVSYLKRRDSAFPNLIIRNMLVTLGYRAAILKKGVISIRTDLVGSEFIGEIEFGEDILETPRSILDDVAVMASRYKVDFSKVQTLIFIDKLPHVRSEIWEVIEDIKKITGISIQTVTFLYLFIRIWEKKKYLTDDGKLDFFINKSFIDYRNGIYKKYMPSCEIENLSEREEVDIMSQSN